MTSENLDAARSGAGPRFIEALTYRMGAHTTSDDPTKYRDSAEVEVWGDRDPITRYERHLRRRGEGDAFFHEVAQEAEDLAADVRARTMVLQDPTADKMFQHVYSDPHPLIEAERAWFEDYESSLEGDPA